MIRFTLALLILAVLTPDSRACPQQRRGGLFSRVVAVERATLRLPARVATAPVRVVSGGAVSSMSSTSGYSYRSTTYAAPTPRVLFVPVPVR